MGRGDTRTLPKICTDRTTGQLGQSGRDSLVVQFFRGFSADRTVWSVWRVEGEVRAPTRQTVWLVGQDSLLDLWSLQRVEAEAPALSRLFGSADFALVFFLLFVFESPLLAWDLGFLPCFSRFMPSYLSIHSIPD